MKRSAKPVQAMRYDLVTPVLRDFTAIVVGLLSRDGLLVDANQGFLQLLPSQIGGSAWLDVRDAFIQPRFDQFAARSADTGDGTVCRGIFTIGNVNGGVRTVRGSIYALGDDLLLVAERDVAQLEQSVSTLHSLNDELAEARREIARLERQLTHRTISAKNAIADRETLLDALPRRLSKHGVDDNSIRTDYIDGPMQLLDGVFLEWTEDMGTGISGLDAEHRDLIRRMYSLVNSSQTVGDPAPLLSQTREFIDATARHFAHEERVMKRIGFPSHQKHKADHDRLLGEAHEVLTAIETAHSENTYPSFLTFVRHNLSEHTRNKDRKIRAYIALER